MHSPTKHQPKEDTMIRLPSRIEISGEASASTSHSRVPLLPLLLITNWLVAYQGQAQGLRTPTSDPPNIVLVLADDLGWADLGCYGADLHETPHLDQLAAQSVRFTQAYAMSVCSPTRAMLLTGRHAARLGITVWIEASLRESSNRPLRDGKSRHDLPHSETTLASRLRDAGYLTALVGKWHLGDASHFPETHGFDINVGGHHWGAPHTYWWPYRGSGRFADEYRYVPHLDYGQPGEYLTDRLTDEAIRVIDHAQKQSKPFFLYLAHYAPHTPIEAKPDDVAYFAKKVTPELNHQNPVYAGMIKSIDESVGRVINHLRDLNLDQQTIIIFTSDNGGFVGSDRYSSVPGPVTNNHPLRSGKGSLYEGGTRVPLMVHWPKLTPRDGATCEQPVSLADLYPTLLGAAGVKHLSSAETDDSLVYDGRDLTDILKQPDATLDRDTLFFHYPHYYATTTPASAIRQGDWKLIEFFEDGRIELFNLADDPGEQNDLADQQTEVAQQLRSRLAAWRVEVRASLPEANPDYLPPKRAADSMIPSPGPAPQK